ncbi:hypothetical protein MPSEU_000356300 [Mayamaea pseudoterrestris]|nr:hypothetical protein MPSEU_000356300 [Mayamaea pseudoterrestris]
MALQQQSLQAMAQPESSQLASSTRMKVKSTDNYPAAITALSVNDVLKTSLLVAMNDVMKESALVDCEHSTRNKSQNVYATQDTYQDHFAAIDEILNAEEIQQPRRVKSFRHVVHEEIVFVPEVTDLVSCNMNKSFNLSDGSTTGSCTTVNSEEQCHDDSQEALHEALNENKRMLHSSGAAARASRRAQRTSSSKRSSSLKSRKPLTTSPCFSNGLSRSSAISKAPPDNSRRNRKGSHQQSDVTGSVTKARKQRGHGNRKVYPQDAQSLETLLVQHCQEKERIVRTKEATKNVLRRHLEKRISGDKSNLIQLQESAVGERSHDSHESEDSQIVPFHRKERSIYKPLGKTRQIKSASPHTQIQEGRARRRGSVTNSKAPDTMENHELDHTGGTSLAQQLTPLHTDDAPKVASIAIIRDLLQEQMKEHGQRSTRRSGETRTRRRNSAKHSAPCTTDDKPAGRRRRSQSRRRTSMAMHTSSDNATGTCARQSRRASTSCITRSVSPTTIRYTSQEFPLRAPVTPGCRRKTLSAAGDSMVFFSPSASRTKLNLSASDFHVSKSDLILMEKASVMETFASPVVVTTSLTKSNNITALLSSIRGSLGIMTPPKDDTRGKIPGHTKQGPSIEPKHIPNLRPNSRDSAAKAPHAIELEMEEDFVTCAAGATDQVTDSDDGDGSINLEDFAAMPCPDTCAHKRRARKTTRVWLNQNRSQSQLGHSSACLMGRSSSNLSGRTALQVHAQDTYNEQRHDNQQDLGSKTPDAKVQPYQKRLSMAKMSHGHDD